MYKLYPNDKSKAVELKENALYLHGVSSSLVGNIIASWYSYNYWRSNEICKQACFSSHKPHWWVRQVHECLTLEEHKSITNYHYKKKNKSNFDSYICCW